MDKPSYLWMGNGRGSVHYIEQRGDKRKILCGREMPSTGLVHGHFGSPKCPACLKIAADLEKYWKRIGEAGK